MRELWGVGTQALKDNYSDRRLPTDPMTFEDYYARTNPAAAEISATNLLTTLIDNDRVGPTILHMHWNRVPLERSKVSLLNSDRPLDRPLGLSDPRAYIALPIAPDMLFLASNDAALARVIFEGDHTEAAKKMNKTVVSQAREFVWGVDDRQLAFVQKHMGTGSLAELRRPGFPKNQEFLANGSDRCFHPVFPYVPTGSPSVPKATLIILPLRSR